MPGIFISTSSFDLEIPEIKTLQEMGYEITLNPLGRRLKEDEIGSFLAEYNVEGLLAGVEPLNENVLKGAPQLRTISRCGVGTDNVDLNAAQNLGITVTNTPDAPTQAVAELAAGLTLAVLRKIPQQDNAIRASEWLRPMGTLISGKSVGIIGLGRIGLAYAKIMEAFGATISAYDPHLTASPSGSIALIDEKHILQNSDIISLHIPAVPQSPPYIGSDKIAQLKAGVILINTARGQLIDETALLNALNTGHLAGAGLDVFMEEPYKGPLRECENVVLTAHTGSYAREARALQEQLAAQNLIDELKKLQA